MDRNKIIAAFTVLGRILPPNPVIEVLIVGAASGLLTNELGGLRATGDIDVLLVIPPGHWDQLQDASARVNQSVDLPANWLNRDAGLYAEGLPPDWKTRRIDVGRFGALQVWAVGRLDLIAMKFYSHRPRDREDLASMKVTTEERKFVLAFLDSIVDASNRSKIELAKHYAAGQD